LLLFIDRKRKFNFSAVRLKYNVHSGVNKTARANKESIAYLNLNFNRTYQALGMVVLKGDSSVRRNIGIDDGDDNAIHAGRQCQNYPRRATFLKFHFFVYLEHLAPLGNNENFALKLNGDVLKAKMKELKQLGKGNNCAAQKLELPVRSSSPVKHVIDITDTAGRRTNKRV